MVKAAFCHFESDPTGPVLSLVWVGRACPTLPSSLTVALSLPLDICLGRNLAVSPTQRHPSASPVHESPECAVERAEGQRL